MSASEEVPRELAEYVALVEAEEFYEAHEVLEDLWVIEVPPLKEAYKGLIMAAVALCHWQRGNLASSRRMFDAALPRLDESAAGLMPGLELVGFVHTLRMLRKLLDTDAAPAWSEARRSAWRPLRMRDRVDRGAFPN